MSAWVRGNLLWKGRIFKKKSEIPQNDLTKPNIEGQIIDPNNGKVIEGNYDIGHKPGHEWRNNKIEYEKQGFTRKQVIEAENNPDNYHLEDPSSNRSHKYEKK